MTPGVIINRDTQSATEEITTLNHLLNAGARESFRIADIVDFEPKSLDDSFQIIINIPDSKIKELLNPQNLLQPANSSFKLETATMLKR